MTVDRRRDRLQQCPLWPAPTQNQMPEGAGYFWRRGEGGGWQLHTNRVDAYRGALLNEAV